MLFEISDIAHAVNGRTLSRGTAYFGEKRVKDLQRLPCHGEDEIHLRARVEGSTDFPYQVDVWIYAHHKVNKVVSLCTCPVRTECKHAVAVCLQYLNLDEQQVPNNIFKSQDELDTWMSSLEEVEQEEGFAFEPKEKFIAYVLRPFGNSLDISLFIATVKKDGTLFQGKQATIYRLYNDARYYRPKYIRDEDMALLRLIYKLNEDNYGDYTLLNAEGAFLLTQLATSGRLFWKNLLEAPLSLSSPRPPDLYWKEDEKEQGFRMVAGALETSRIIYTTPPIYIDPHTREIGVVETLFTPKQLENILNAPFVPAAIAKEISQRLTLNFPDIPSPTPVEIFEIKGVIPVIKFSLFGRHTSDGYTHFGKLTYLYDGVEVPGFGLELVSLVSFNTQIYRVFRDVESEDEVLVELLALSFIVATLGGQTLLVLEEDGLWKSFLNRVPELEKAGWVIEFEDSFKLSFLDEAKGFIDIKESNNQWFDLNFLVDINGKKHALLPLIVPILERYELHNLPETFDIRIDEFQYVEFSKEHIRPFLEMLYELYDRDPSFGEESLRLSHFDALFLAGIQSQRESLFTIKGGKKLIALGKKLSNFTKIAKSRLPKGLNATLRPYQKEGLNWLQFLREYQLAGILADDMGLGKTIQTLANLLLEKESKRMKGPSLIVAPTSLMGNWKREVERFTPDLSVLILQGPNRKNFFKDIQNYDLVLTTYPLLPRDSEVLLSNEFYYLILDESQMIKNPKARASKVVRELTATHRLCLTGTPLENHLGELWSQFDFLLPGFLGQQKEFNRSYRNPIEREGDVHRQQSLSKRVRPFLLRRAKEDVAKDLPPKTEIIRRVQLHKKQALLYETIRVSMEKRVREAIAEKGLARSHIAILDALLKLRQTCCDPRTVSLKSAKNIKQSAKLDLLMEMVPELLDEGHKILIFSQFTRMLSLIQKELETRSIGFTKLTGQTKKRDEAISRFQEGEVDVFLISLKAGGVGLNLTQADTVIIFDPWWNPAAESQAADRAHRIGQDKPVFVYKLVAENTVEEKILAMQERKKALAAGVYARGADKKNSAFDADDLEELFRPLPV